jgi:hypothetical protein
LISQTASAGIWKSTIEVDWLILQCLQNYEFPNVKDVFLYGWAADAGSIDLALWQAITSFPSITSMSLTFSNPLIFFHGMPKNLEKLSLLLEEEGWTWTKPQVMC